MELYQHTSLKQTQTLSPQFIQSQQLLQMPVTELRDEILKELSENPALEMEEIPTCPQCNRPMRGSVCEACGKRDDPEYDETELFIKQQIMDYDPDGAPYESGGGGGMTTAQEGEGTPIGHFTSHVGSFHDYLIHGFLAMNYPEGTEELGKFLIRSINDDGYIELEMDRVKALFEVEEEVVESVLSVIHMLDPLGVGARNAREALLIQLRAMEEEGKEHPLAHRLIDEYFELLGRNKIVKIANELEVDKSIVMEALDYIRRNLNPYPGRQFTNGAPVQLARPAMVIRFDGRELKYEVLELSDFRLKINRGYVDMYDKYNRGGGNVSRKEMSHIREYFRRAKFYRDSVETRRQTLDKIAKALCEEQQEFLIKGLPNFNTELTQGSLAQKIELHESTVSRAMSGKFVQVPSGDVLSFDFFFDSSVRPKEYIRNIIAQEDPKKTISDKQLVDMLKEKGIKLARRTVAKYREELKIPSSYERRRA